MAQEWAAHNLKVVEGGIDFRHRSGVITFDTLFKPDSKPLEVLDRIVLRELEKRGHQIPHPFNDLGVKAYQNFAITDDAVIFFFAQGLVLAQVDGPLEVSVPRTELAALLALPRQILLDDQQAG
jgi:hypothetical protein